MSSKNPRKGKGKKRSTCVVRKGKIIRLELSRGKRGGECKATPLLGTGCGTQHSQQPKTQRFVCRKQEKTSRPKGRTGTGAPTRGKQAMHTP